MSNIQVGDRIYCTIKGQIVSAKVLKVCKFLGFSRYLCGYTVNDFGIKYSEAKWRWRVWK